jgi:hypothetical protein
MKYIETGSIQTIKDLFASSVVFLYENDILFLNERIKIIEIIKKVDF